MNQPEMNEGQVDLALKAEKAAHDSIFAAVSILMSLGLNEREVESVVTRIRYEAVDAWNDAQTIAAEMNEGNVEENE